MSEPVKAKRPRNLPGEGGRLRADLIAAADRLLGAAGAEEGVSLRAVAREVGIAAPSVYLHFPSKEALLRAVVDEHFEALRQAVLSAVAREREPAARLLAGCLAYCRFATEQPGAYRILFSLPRPQHDDRCAEPPGDAPGEAAFATLSDAIAACMAAGVAPAGDPFRVATDVWAALHGMVTLRRSLPEFAWPDLTDQVASVLRGLVGVALDRQPAGAADAR